MPTANQATDNQASGRGAPFTALLLVGGAGTRLRSVVADRPKPLADVGGRPFVERLLAQLQAAGCERVVLCSGHFGEQFAAVFGDRWQGLELAHSHEPQPLGTAGALRLALPLLRGQGALVCNGDSYCDADLAAFVAWARQQPELPALLAAQVADTGRYGSLQCAGERVTAFGEKTGAGGPGAINAGVYWLPRAVLAAIPQGRDVSLEREVLPGLVTTGLRARQAGGAFLDIGVPDDYARAAAFFAALTAPARQGRRLLVVDRDGTLIVERHYLADPASVELLPGVVEGLRAFRTCGYQIAIVSNQSGVGRGFFTLDAMHAVNAELQRQLAVHGIAVDRVLCCPHHPDEHCACRKPEPGLLDSALTASGCAPHDCLVVGDKDCDVELGRRRGARTALVRTGYGRDTELERRCEPDVVVDDLEQLAALEGKR